MLIQCTRKKKIMTLFYTECRCVSTDMVAREPPGALLAAEKKEKKTHQSTWHCLSYSFFSFCMSHRRSQSLRSWKRKATSKAMFMSAFKIPMAGK